MAIDPINVTITEGGTPPTTSDPSMFDTRADDFLTWLVTFATQLVNLVGALGTFITQLNSEVETINGYATTAEESAAVASGAVNYQGDWSAGSYSKSQSVSYTDGSSYVSKIDNNTNEPSGATDANWLKVQGGYSYTTKTANYTAKANDYIFLDASGGAFTITADTLTIGQHFILNTKDVETNNVTLDGDGVTIVDAKGTYLTYPIDADFVEVKVIFDGTYLRIMI